MTTEIILSPAPALQPAPHFTPTPKAASGFWNSPPTRSATTAPAPRSPYLRMAPVQRDTCSCD
jgi:hypothetical protein